MSILTDPPIPRRNVLATLAAIVCGPKPPPDSPAPDADTLLLSFGDGAYFQQFRVWPPGIAPDVEGAFRMDNGHALAIVDVPRRDVLGGLAQPQPTGSESASRDLTAYYWADDPRGTCARCRFRCNAVVCHSRPGFVCFVVPGDWTESPDERGTR